MNWMVLWMMAGTAAAAEPTLQAGFAERDISPAIGMEAPGGYGKAYHRAFHDPCKARAVVFDDGRHAVALVGVDTLTMRAETVRKVRREIARKTGLSESAILLGASHTHSGGPAGFIRAGDFDHADALVKKLAYAESTTIDPVYLERFEAGLIEAVAAAHAARAPVMAGVGRGRAENVTFNRRFRMRDGFTMTHPGQGNPGILEPAGPVDPEVGVIGVWNRDKQLLGCVVHFSCHCTTGPGGISADYVYYIEKMIQGYFGARVGVVFLNGASADVTQVDNRNPFRQPTGDQWAQRIGSAVGAEAVKALVSMERGVLGPVNFRSEMLEFARRAPSPERVRASRALVEQPGQAERTDVMFAKEIVLLDALIRREPRVTAEVQAIQVGPAVFLTTPAEFFCQSGLEQKARSGFPFTFPISLANGCIGYVPPEEAFAETGGGYETRLTSYSNLEIGAASRLRDTGIQLARSFSPGAVPESPRRQPFGGKPWSYGNNRPEKD